jgi:hypothetical protein
MSNQLHPENLPIIVARCSLDTQYEAWILDNASVSINDPEGTPFMLNPERAFNLLDFLYRHRDLLHSAVHQPGELPEWAKQDEYKNSAANNTPGLTQRTYQSGYMRAGQTMSNERSNHYGNL